MCKFCLGYHATMNDFQLNLGYRIVCKFCLGILYIFMQSALHVWCHSILTYALISQLEAAEIREVRLLGHL